MSKTRNLRLTIDAHMVGERETGNETYTLNLVKSLLDQFPQHTYHILTSHRAAIEPHLSLPASSSLVDISPNPFVRIPLAIPRHVKESNTQLLHVNYIAPPRLTCPVVTTIHDISFEFYPQYFSLRDRLLLSLLVPFTARRAAAVIAVSEKTRDDIIARYRIPAHKVVVTYEGVDAHFCPLDRAKAKEFAEKTYNIDGDFILSVGNLQPRKNLRRLVQSYAKLKQNQEIDLALVIVGKALWRESEVYSLVQALGIEKDVIFTGYVPDEHLPLLYNAAQFFVFPSLYEGFGLPPLEAMACGTPVVCSNTGALPEVVEDATLTFDPHNLDELTNCLLQMASSPETQIHFSERGLVQASKFSWSAMARETMEVYQAVIDRQRSE